MAPETRRCWAVLHRSDNLVSLHSSNVCRGGVNSVAVRSVSGGGGASSDSGGGKGTSFGVCRRSGLVGVTYETQFV